MDVYRFVLSLCAYHNNNVFRRNGKVGAASAGVETDTVCDFRLMFSIPCPAHSPIFAVIVVVVIFNVFFFFSIRRRSSTAIMYAHLFKNTSKTAINRTCIYTRAQRPYCDRDYFLRGRYNIYITHNLVGEKKN